MSNHAHVSEQHGHLIDDRMFDVIATTLRRLDLSTAGGLRSVKELAICRAIESDLKTAGAEVRSNRYYEGVGSRGRYDLLIDERIVVEVKKAFGVDELGAAKWGTLARILSPLFVNRSAIADCRKMVSQSSDGWRRIILLIGFDHVDADIDVIYRSFEAVAAAVHVQLEPVASVAYDLCHPGWRRGVMGAWEVVAA